MIQEYVIVAVAVVVLAIVMAVIVATRERDKALHELQAGLKAQNIAQIKALNERGVLKEYVKMMGKKEEK